MWNHLVNPPPTPRTSWWAAGSLVALVCVVAVASSCTSTEYAEKSDEVVEVPQEEVELEGLGADRWCSDFGHDGLDQVVERAWSDNLELKSAWARLRQAEAAAEIAGSTLWPNVRANAGVDYSQDVRGDEFDGQDGAGNGSGAESFWELSAAAAYEVDVWGRLRHRTKAAELEAEAVEAQARALAITLTSQVAEAWFDVIAQRERLALFEAQLAVSEDILAITRQRLRHGLVSALDVAQQEQNIESIRGEVHDARCLLEVSQHRLAVLVGEAPSDQDFVDVDTLPEVEPIPKAGVPADLLERRPDVRAAYFLLRSADRRTAAAVGDRLPRLQLSAALGFGATNIANLFTQLFWSLGAGISQPIFEGGRLRAEVERSEAIAQEQLYEYANTLLVAIREVRDALALELTQKERIDSLQREIGLAREVVEMARKRYRNGTVDYLRVLTGLQALQEVQRTLIEARRQQISNRIALCRALGGSWVDEVESSLDHDE